MFQVIWCRWLSIFWGVWKFLWIKELGRKDESVANPRYIDKQLTLVFMTKISPSTWWWQLKYFLCSLLLGLMTQFDEYFFRWTETTNQSLFGVMTRIYFGALQPLHEIMGFFGGSKGSLYCRTWNTSGVQLWHSFTRPPKETCQNYRSPRVKRWQVEQQERC